MFALVYGTVTKPLTSKILSKERCPACEKTGHVEITLYQRYVSIYWIPTFGLGVKTGARCTLCGHTIKGISSFAKKNWSESLDEAFRALKSGYRRTLWQRVYPWTFSVIMVAAIAAAAGSIAYERHDREASEAEVRQYVMQPKPGDIYKVEWRDSSNPSMGTLVKLLRIDGDQMTIVRNKADIIGFENLRNAKAWAALSRDAAAFDPREYVVSMAFFQGRARTSSSLGELVVGSTETFGDRYLQGQLLRDFYGIRNIVERPEK